MELNGTWRAAPSDEALRRAYPDPDFDESGWEPLDVPGHWQESPAFAEADGPVLFRRRFEHRVPRDGERAWLTFDGVFYQADVWLDGVYTGDTEGYFAPHTFEVTAALRAQREHVVAAEVTCTPPSGDGEKHNITGAFQPTRGAGGSWNPGGIWRPVRVHTTGPVAFTRLSVTCPEATPDRAVLAFDASVDAITPAAVTLRTRVGGGGQEHLEQQQVAAGDNRIEWRVTIDRPPLWWPHALGAPVLVDVSVAVELDGGESDRRSLTTGLRSVRLDDFVLAVNGERLFLKGANQDPAPLALAGASSADLERDILLAKETGLDLLRLHAHISRTELYDAADRHGMLLWQDLPLTGRYARSVRKQAVRQARQAVDLLAHHPSIAVWCAHDEPVDTGFGPRAGDVADRVLGSAAAFAVPAYAKTVLDGSLHRALHRADRSRPTIPYSGVAGRSDAHLWFGWHHGNERDLPRFASGWPRAVRFVGAFGAQAPPASPGLLGTGSWRDVDWDRVERELGLDRAAMARNGLEPSDFDTFDEWCDAAQAHQATVVKHHVETLRRLKYRPAGGFTVSSFADGVAGVTFAVLDHERRPKLAHAALAAACRDVIVVADRPEAGYLPGDPVVLDVHVVNDRRSALGDVTVSARLDWDGGSREWRWSGDAPPDSVVRVGTIDATAPAAGGQLRLTLDLDAPAAGTRAGNSYVSQVTRVHRANGDRAGR